MPPHLPPALSSPTLRERKGEISGAGAILRWHLSTIPCPQITPLPQCGSGAGGEGGPHLPPSPLPLSHGEWQGEGGRERTNAEHPSRNGRTGSVRA